MINLSKKWSSAEEVSDHYKRLTKKSLSDDLKKANQGNEHATLRLISFSPDLLYTPWAHKKILSEAQIESWGIKTDFFEKLGNAIAKKRQRRTDNIETRIRKFVEGFDLNRKPSIKIVFDGLTQFYDEFLEKGIIDEKDPAFSVLESEENFRKFIVRKGIHKPTKITRRKRSKNLKSNI